jgi:Xaa-Pro aminopeptidase
MKSDLANLMQSKNVDALLVLGDTFHNPSMVYFSGVAHVSEAMLVLKQGNEPILYFNSMERDEAAQTGLETRSLNLFDFKKLFDESGENALIARAKLINLVLADAEVSTGRVALYGRQEAGEALGLMDELRNINPALELIGEFSDTMLLKARATKDADELEKMRDVGKRTLKIVDKVRNFLASQKADGDLLVDDKGAAITVGRIKSLISLWLAEEGLDNPHNTIFAPGAEGGVPHSLGSTDAKIRLGQPIVFDIFPVDAGGGYFFDFTRTWCIGHVPDEVQKLYDDVLSVYQTLMGEIKGGTACKPYQDRTCELFAAQGHPTVAEDPNIEIGYVHGLAHGLGLDVHEAPRFSRQATDQDMLLPGAVVTVEPGLYYPDRGMGCRLEDAVVVLPDGNIEVLVPYPLDLIIELKS